jgi:hypothetical protein
MVKSLTPYTLFALVACLLTVVQAKEFNGRRGPSRSQPEERRDRVRELAPRATSSTWYPGQQDPWATFPQFSWNWVATGWEWTGHSLSYVKEWYYDT